MYKGKRILAVIPARGGSRGLPRKNIRLFGGKPLIAWTIGTALKSAYLDKVIVSTDDKAIAAVAERCGAEVPFRRPKALATDKAGMMGVVFHAIDYAEKTEGSYDLVLLLQPTSPLRSSSDIDNAIRLFFTKHAGSIVSVCAVDHHPYWSNALLRDGSMKRFVRRCTTHVTRQELVPHYRVNGALYLAAMDWLKRTKSFFGTRTYAYIMPRERSVDIDDMVDFKFAESLLRS